MGTSVINLTFKQGTTNINSLNRMHGTKSYNLKYVNLCGPCVVTFLQHTPIFEWNKGNTRSQEQKPQRHGEIGLCAQNTDTIYE